MRSQLIVGFVMEAFYCSVLDRSVHSIDLTVGPRMVGLGQAVLYPFDFADHVETRWPGIDGVAVPGLLGELDAVIGENGVGPIEHGFQQMLKELPGRISVRRCNELSDNEFVRPSMPRKRQSLPSAVCTSAMSICKNPPDGDASIACRPTDGVSRELLALELVALRVRQPRYNMSLQASMQG